MNYSEAKNYLSELANYEKKSKYSYVDSFELKRVYECLALLGSPQKKIKSILIAGTNAKGSTAAILSKLLSSSMNEVGLFTSPHLISIRERIQINSKLITKKDFAFYLTEISRVLDSSLVLFRLTFFEILTVLAIFYFSVRKIDIAVFEVGLGGRLDATNVLEPLLSIITPVALDHQLILGESLSEIAMEKAGIIKANSVVVSAKQVPEVEDVLKQAARDKNSQIYFYGNKFKVQDKSILKNGWVFSFSEYLNCKINLLAEHQVDNACLALMAIDILADKGFSPFDTKKIIQNLSCAVWPGRTEKVSVSPYIILDGAHNVHAAKALKQLVVSRYSGRDIVFIFAAMADKDYDGVLSVLAEVGKTIWVTSVDNSRCLPTKELGKTAQKYFDIINYFESPNEICKKLLKRRNDKKIYIVTGSLFLIGCFKEALNKYGAV